VRLQGAMRWMIAASLAALLLLLALAGPWFDQSCG
jgi:hypothetical protein